MSRKHTTTNSFLCNHNVNLFYMRICSHGFSHMRAIIPSRGWPTEKVAWMSFANLLVMLIHSFHSHCQCFRHPRCHVHPHIYTCTPAHLHTCTLAPPPTYTHITTHLYFASFILALTVYILTSFSADTGWDYYLRSSQHCGHMARTHCLPTPHRYVYTGNLYLP